METRKRHQSGYDVKIDWGLRVVKKQVTEKFEDMLREYKNSLVQTSKLMIEKEILEMELHFLDYPYRRLEMPLSTKNKTIGLNISLSLLCDELEILSKKLSVQKRNMKTLSEENDN